MTTVDDVAKQKSEPSTEQTAPKELVPAGSGAGLVPDRHGRTAQAVHQTVLDIALNEQMPEHLGHDKHRAPEDRESTTRAQRDQAEDSLTEAAGQVQIDVPRDRDATFTPQIVEKRQRRLTGVDEIVLSL